MPENSGGADAQSRDEKHYLSFEGRFGELLPIVLLNILLTIVTLGIFRFWAKNRVRRYLWSKLRLLDEPFEYLGTGMELFLGFLIVFFLVLLPLGGLLFYGQYLIQTLRIGTGLTIMLSVYMIFFFLYGVAIYRMRRYQMSRTSWRGIRGGQTQSSLKYGGLFFILTILRVITFGIATPYVANKLWKWEVNNKRFGTGKFDYQEDSGGLWGPFFASIGLAVAAYIAFIILYIFVADLTEGAWTIDMEALQRGDFSDFGLGVYAIFAFYLLFLLTFNIFVLISFNIYQVALLRHLTNHTQYENMLFEINVSAWKYLGFTIVNILIIFFSLGLADPFVQMRWVRFYADHLTLIGVPDFEHISQTVLEKPRFGEGLADAFDIG